MSLITWAVSIDTDDDLIYSETGENIVAQVRSFESMIGMEDELERVADVTACRLVCDNSSGAFFPEQGTIGGALVGRFLRLHATVSAVTYTVYTGQIEHIRPTENSSTAVVECLGRWKSADSVVNVGVYPQTTGDVVIDDVLQAAGLRGALQYTDGPFWILEYPGFSEVEGCRVGGPITNVTTETGVTDMTYVGRDYILPTVRKVVTDVTRAEWGWFAENHEGVFQWLNRHTTLEDHTLSASLGGADLVAADYVHGHNLINQVKLRLNPYVIGVDQVLWSAVAPLRFPVGLSTRTIHFLDTDGRLVGVHGDLTYDLDFYDDDTGGSVVTTGVMVRPTVLSSGVKLEVQNPTSGALWLHIGATVRGTPLIRDVTVGVVRENTLSRTLYGVAPLELSLPSFTDQAAADDLVDFLLTMYGSPRSVVRSVKLRARTATIAAYQVGLHLFDLVEVVLATLGHVERYTIIGVKHVLEADGILETQFFLAPQFKFWLVEVANYGELEQATIVGY